jgi:hypothetical protein
MTSRLPPINPETAGAVSPDDDTALAIRPLLDPVQPIAPSKMLVHTDTARTLLDNFVRRRERTLIEEALDLVEIERSGAFYLDYATFKEFRQAMYPASDGARGQQLYQFGRHLRAALDGLDGVEGLDSQVIEKLEVL